MNYLSTPAAALIFIAGSNHALAEGPFGASLELSSLDGANGFVLNGIDRTDFSGDTVASAGDFNGDGIDDFVIGAFFADPNGIQSGESYVIFGDLGVGAGGTMELSSLDGANGFVINGIDAGDQSGVSVSSAGDVNADGIDDLVIGALFADPNGTNSGESYVVFGAPGVGAGGTLELSSLDGANGFVINGIDAYDWSGTSVSSAGDVNGDGIDDLVIGAYHPFTYSNGSSSGNSYVVFGAPGVGAGGTLELSSLNGANGFVINGIDAHDHSGRSVSSAGDVNADGIDDILIAAVLADPNGNGSGESYVVFGAPGVGAGGTLELSSLNGANGFVINGIDADDHSGSCVSYAGDVNADGIDDLVIGASGADPNGDGSGESYVVFGAPSVGAGGTLELSSLNGANGFVINGIDAYDFSGGSVSSAGDINADGIDDLLFGCGGADPNGSDSGESYVVFGAPGVGASGTLELSSLSGANGFTINGVDEGDRSGISVSSAGDVNADGIGDLVIGARDADPNGRSSGATYVIFGIPCNEADLTGDCVVTAVDLAQLLSAWGPCPAEPAPCVADLNADGQIGAADLAILIAGWTD